MIQMSQFFPELSNIIYSPITKIRNLEQGLLYFFAGFLVFCLFITWRNKKGIRQNFKFLRLLVYLLFYMALIFGTYLLFDFNKHEIIALSYTRIPLPKYEDNDGKKAEFSIFILSEEYNWRKGSSEDVEFNGKLKNINSHLEAILKNHKAIKGVICVGTASRVGISGESQTLSISRAKQLKLWIQNTSAWPDLDFVFPLNLGQYNKPGDIQNSSKTKDDPEQRRIIIIGVTYYDENISFCEALKKTLKKEYDPPLPFNIDDYSRWKLMNSTLIKNR